MTSLRTIVLILLVFFVGGCATAPRRPGVAMGPDDLKNLCDRYSLHWDVDPYTQAVTLIRNRDKAVALVGSPVVMVKGRMVHLSSPVTRNRNMIVVPADFKNKVVDELVREISHAIQKFKTVVVDAGHGGKDPGAIGVSGSYEKTVVLDIARRLKRRLEEKGVQVIMTRDSDEFISLQERTEIASRANADVFVSIHANASPARSARGMEIYYLRYLKASEKEDPQIQVNRRHLFRSMEMSKDSSVLEDIVFDMLYDYKQAESRHLADYVAQNVSRTVRVEDRGSKSSGFFVLRNTLVPAILVETGFLSNRQDEEQLLDSRYRQDLADALAETILRYARKSH
jgi:N-acetylmuramoyl-L-alanine amidase